MVVIPALAEHPTLFDTLDDLGLVSRIEVPLGTEAAGPIGYLALRNKTGDAYSEAARAKVIDWFTSTVLSRLDNPKTDKIVIVAQRLHVDDLVGYLLDQGGWFHLNLPAIAVREEKLALC